MLNLVCRRRGHLSWLLALVLLPMASHAATVNWNTSFLFNDFTVVSGSPTVPFPRVSGQFSLSFDTAQAVTHKAVDSIGFVVGTFPVDRVLFDYRPSVEVSPGVFNFQIDVYRDHPSSFDDPGTTVLAGATDDFLFRVGGLPGVLASLVAGGGGSVNPDVLGFGTMLYGGPGGASFYFSSRETLASTLSVSAPVPLPASGGVAVLALGILTRFARRRAGNTSACSQCSNG